ncbi:tripartite motif-containing protein 45-like [Patiria miniata]|uniref:Uncharacterized protein n=1 Tax=Patiria miniata TaxID=46514 RepID=A0A914BTB7_PATMI|nr:tripartite motif-containing protein 45-like [Patiria miniata]
MATGGITAESGLGSILQGHLECCICHNRYHEPKMLECSHSFCLTCLQELQKSQKRTDDKIRCPLCQSETILPAGKVAKLTTNYGLICLVEEVTQHEHLKGQMPKVICQTCDEKNEAVSRCMDCECFLCQQCQTAHQRFAAFKTHNIVPVDEIEGESAPKKDVSQCKIHPTKELCFYCNTCEMLICRQCAASSHKEPIHMYVDLNTAIDTCLIEANERISQALSVKAYNKISGSWQSLRKTLGVMFGETNSLISKTAEQKIKEIKHKEKQLKHKAQVAYRKKYKRLAEMEVAEHTVQMADVHKEMTDANCREILKFRQDLLHDLKDVNGGETEDLSRDLSFISFKENKEQVKLGSIRQKRKVGIAKQIRNHRGLHYRLLHK